MGGGGGGTSSAVQVKDGPHARRGSGPASESELSDSESSSSDSLRLAVKNTFIDVEASEGDEQRELPLHLRGARTCTARLSQIGHFPDAEDEELSTEASDTEFDEAEDTGRSTFLVEATPEAQSMRQFLASAAFSSVCSMSPVEARAPEPQSLPCPAPAQAREARQVMLQVPLELAAASQAGSGDLQVAVVSSASQSLGGSTVIDLRVVVGPSGELEVFRSPVGQQLLSAALGSLAAVKTSSASMEPSKSSTSVPPSPAPESATPADDVPPEVPLPPAQRRETRAKTAPTGAKSSMVCCHWKNKGWCRYQENCRFAHPEHKRGVGLNAGKGAAVASTPSGSSPGGVTCNMWAMPCDWAGLPSFVQQL